MSAHYFLGDSMFLDPRYRATIILRGESGQEVGMVEGNVQNDFSVSGGNTFDEQGAHIESVASSLPIVSTGQKLLNAGQKLLSAGGGSNRFHSQVGSQLHWQGSRSSALNLELTFVCLKHDEPKEDVISRVNTLMKAVYPELNDSAGGVYFNPPLGYQTKIWNGKSKQPMSGRSALTSSGKVTLKIGEWFHADYLVIEDVQFSFSKEVNKAGKPIYAIGSIALRPYRTLTYEDYKKWFIL